ncbi:MAG: polysaccharide deacetylase family protein [Bacteroidetes bacterium]|nr:polysaccharide deacetylase family protein [Bacteroidota bacterium]
MLNIKTKIKQRLRWKAIELRYKFGFTKNFNVTNPGRRLLLYHGIDKFGRTDINSRFISETEFEKQLIWLKKNCHIVTMQDYFSGYQHLEKLTIAISFDDGYRNNFNLALPLLEKHEVPATFFITTAPLDGMNILWPDLLDIAGFVLKKELEFNEEQFVFRSGIGYISTRNGKYLKNYLRVADVVSIKNFVVRYDYLLQELKLINGIYILN